MTLALLRPIMRHSVTRDAYVLRGIGNRMGPVLQRRTERTVPGSSRSGQSPQH